MQAIRIAAAIHYTTSLLIDNENLVVHHDILLVLLEKSISLQELGYGVDTLTLDGIVLHKLVLLCELILITYFSSLNVGHFSADIRQNEKLRVVRSRSESVNTLICQLDRIILLVNDEEEWICGDGHVLVVLLHVVVLRLEHLCLNARLREELNEGAVLGETLVGAEQR